MTYMCSVGFNDALPEYNSKIVKWLFLLRVNGHVLITWNRSMCFHKAGAGGDSSRCNIGSIWAFGAQVRSLATTQCK